MEIPRCLILCVASSALLVVACGPAAEEEELFTDSSAVALAGAIPLSNGVAMTNLSGAAGSSMYYRLTVPPGQTRLMFEMSGGTGDADMYVNFGSAPTTSVYSCRPYMTGNKETCSFNSPPAGDWYVMLRGYAAYSGVSLNGTHE